jgi:hypothetical protein
MKRLPRPGLSASLLSLALCAASRCLALTPSEWRHRQALSVAAPGLVRVDLTPASFDAAGPQQEDLRVTDPSGRELAVLLDRPPAPAARLLRPTSFEVRLADGSTEVTVVTGSKERLASILLETPSPFFMRAAQVEVSDDKASWTVLDQGVPVFRQWGAERLELPLGGRQAAFVRITVADGRASPLPFTGVRLLSEGGPAPEPVPVGARLAARDEFAGETVLTVALDGRHEPLAALGIAAGDPLFLRRVAVCVREVRDGLPAERTIGAGTVYRVSVDGAPVRSQLEVPLAFSPDTRELLVHIYNGDSPPLSVDSVRLRRFPTSLLFMAPAAGTYALLSGNPQVGPPHYDLAAFASELRGAHAAVVVPGDIEDVAGYHERDTLGAPPMPDVPLAGAPLDAKDWSFRRSVEIASAGVQELELDPEALARARSDLEDVRLLHDGNQIPFVLERPALARSLELAPVNSPDPKRPTVSLWALHLPKAGLPLRRVVLATSTSLFQRQFRLYEKTAQPGEGPSEHGLAAGLWVRTPEPGSPAARSFELQDRVGTDTLWIETDNGDNPPIALGTAQAVYPVARLVFKVAQTDGFTLAYGNPSASAPRYDLSLVAERLLTSSRNAAHLDAGGEGAAARNPFAGLSGGYLFWGALGLVVVALLLVVAKLLPKPKG